MAEAKQCDRCGAFYVKNKTPVKLMVIDWPKSNSVCLEKFDLCDNCHAELEHFMKEKKKNGKSGDK